MSDEPEQLLTTVSARPRVLLVVDDDSLERFGAITKHIVVGLADVAVRVTVLCRTRRPPSALELGPCSVIHDPPKRVLLRREPPPAVAELVRDGQIDIVHCLSADLAERTRRFPELARLPTAAHITDEIDLRRWNRLWRMPGARSQVWALPATPTLFKGILDTCKACSRFARLVRLGVIGQTGEPIMPTPDHIPSAITMTPLTDDCGLDSVLRAMHAVTSGGREVVLLVLGKGPAEHRFRRLTEQLGLANAVVFVGSLSQWVEAMLGCDILLIPRRPARWTSHVLEAMGAGRVVLASRDNGEDYLLNDQTACLFNTDDVADLTRQWHALLDNPAAAQRLGAAAAQFIRKEHGPSTMIDALVELYAQAAVRTAPPHLSAT